MINWEELKHIHVIRKLEQVLGQWFQAEIFFVDQKGQIRNYDPADRQRQFRNPLCAALLPNDKGREIILKAVQVASDEAILAKTQNFTDSGPLGIEKVFVTKVVIDGEHLGSVYAYSFLDAPLTSEQKQSVKSKIAHLAPEVDTEWVDQALSKMRVLGESERKYFFELVDLVAQEIVSFHTEIAKREERIHELNHQLENRYSYHSMIGKSKPMQELYSLLEKVKNSDSTILVQGENGTGKELIARAVHYNSDRKDQQFVIVNCSAFNENLLESELFGHVRGAFTGAVKDKKGLFEVAHKGTLFLDEIGDMSPTMQVKLLRVLQEGTFMTVGGTDQKKVDVRILAATNRDLKEMVENETFREDLYYRINVINIVVPALRDRKEDIPVLVDHFLVQGCKEKNLPVKKLSKSAYSKVYDYTWPGNIRELQNEIERLVVLSGDEANIPSEILSARIRDFGGAGKVGGVRITAGKLKDAIEELEKTMILEGLRRTKWNKSKLAKELGISRAGLIMKVEKYELDKRRLMRAA